jgi:hypothetical protein
MTKEQIERCTLPTDEIQSDIEITEREIKDYQDELSILRRNPQNNRVRIYMAEGNISRREEFIKDLKQILEHRTQNPTA